MEFDEKSMNCRIVGDYVIGSKLGSGSFAVVWKSRHVHTGAVFAVKEIDKKHFNDNLLKEIEILRNVDHPNIIRLFDVVEVCYLFILFQNDHFYCIMLHMSGPRTLLLLEPFVSLG